MVDNSEQIIQHYLQALQVYTSQAFPGRWAEIQNNLGHEYMDRAQGDRAENIEEAIQHYQQALQVDNRQAASNLWPEIQNNLAVAYGYRIRGERSENIEQSIHYFQQALLICTRQAYPIDWASIQINLGAVYRIRIQGDKLGNLEQAILHCQQALQVCTQKEHPEAWAHAQNTLGTIYQDRAYGDRADNIEQAIQHYQQALQVYNRKAFPIEWAMLQNNLGEAYRSRIHGDRDEDSEQAIQYFCKALEIFTFQGFPEDWLSANSNLAMAYLTRMRGERLENVEQAIQLYQQILTNGRREAFPEHWARNQNNLALAYYYRIRGNRGENIEKAIQNYQQALEVFIRQALPELCAITQLNLATTYQNRIFGEPAENLDKVIEYCQQVLNAYTLQAFPYLWAASQSTLATAYGDRPRGDRRANLEQAIQHYQQALQVFTPQALPRECALTAVRLGNLGFKLGLWSISAEGYQKYLEAQAVLFQYALTRGSQEHELESMQGIAARAAYSLAKAGDLPAALTALEGGLAHLLRESLERNRRDLERLSALGRSNLLARYRLASGRYTALTSTIGLRFGLESEDVTSLSSERYAELQAVQSEIQVIVDEIRHVPGYADFLGSLTAKQIQSLASPVPLVYFAVTSAGGLALITSENRIKPVWLDELGSEALLERLQGATTERPGGYLGEYAAWRYNPNDEVAQKYWVEALDIATHWLWGVVIGPLTEALQAEHFQRAVVLPGGLLGLLPLHAAWREDPAAPTGRRYALDVIGFTYAPSAHALKEARQIAAACALPDGLLAVDNPDGSLHFSDEEVSTALAGFDQSYHLSGQQAGRQQVRNLLPQYPVLHFSTHGQANMTEPLKSALLLADGQLTLDDLLGLHLPGARLAVLSACETGVPGRKLPDEIINLPSGLLQAGVAGVVASLWSVLDISTAMLMARFYELWRKEGLAPPEALRQAQIWLRDTTNGDKKTYFKNALPEFGGTEVGTQVANAFFQSIVLSDEKERSFDHPLHWAAFTYTGV